MNIGKDLFLKLGISRITTWKTYERPKKAKRGTLGFNLETKSLEYCNGTDWFGAQMGKK